MMAVIGFLFLLILGGVLVFNALVMAYIYLLDFLAVLSGYR